MDTSGKILATLLPWLLARTYEKEKEKMVIKNATVIDKGLMAYERVTQLKRIWCT